MTTTTATAAVAHRPAPSHAQPSDSGRLVGEQRARATNGPQRRSLRVIRGPFSVVASPGSRPTNDRAARFASRWFDRASIARPPVLATGCLSPDRPLQLRLSSADVRPCSAEQGLQGSGRGPVSQSLPWHRFYSLRLRRPNRYFRRAAPGSGFCHWVSPSLWLQCCSPSPSTSLGRDDWQLRRSLKSTSFVVSFAARRPNANHAMGDLEAWATPGPHGQAGTGHRGHSAAIPRQMSGGDRMAPHGLLAGGGGRASSCQIAHGTERTSGHPRSTSRVLAGPGRGTGASALPKLTMPVRFPSPARGRSPSQ